MTLWKLCTQLNISKLKEECPRNICIISLCVSDIFINTQEIQSLQVITVGNLYLEVLDDVDDFPGWVRILNECLVRQITQLTKCPHQVPHGLFRHIRAIWTQKCHLRFHTWVVNGMTAEEVTWNQITMLYSINLYFHYMSTEIQTRWLFWDVWQN